MKNLFFSSLLPILLLLFSGTSNQFFAQDPDPNSFVLMEQEPRPTNMDSLRRMIGYPREAVEKKLEGRVVVRILIDEEGQYVKHIFITNTNEIFGNAVNNNIHRIRCLPGIAGGKPIKCWVTLPFDFRLRRPEPESEGKGKKNRNRR